MKRIRLTVQGLINSRIQGNTFALVLGDESHKKRITIIIGQPEAESIVLFLQNTPPPRPITHELMLNILNGFGIELIEINIHAFENGVYHSELLLFGNGKSLVIDSRTSDAVALAVRKSCPIFINEELFDRFAFVVDEEQARREEQNITTRFTVEELESQLKKAVGQEHYEDAARLRDEIARRKKQ